jgi:hypothetical protein
VEGRGRPRRMYQIAPDWIAKAKELAHFWERYSSGHPTTTVNTSAFDNRAFSVGS